jgi:hypothetical protein
VSGSMGAFGITKAPTAARRWPPNSPSTTLKKWVGTAMSWGAVPAWKVQIEGVGRGRGTRHGASKARRTRLGTASGGASRIDSLAACFQTRRRQRRAARSFTNHAMLHHKAASTARRALWQVERAGDNPDVVTLASQILDEPLEASPVIAVETGANLAARTGQGWGQ